MVAAVRAALPDLVVVDHWTADLAAIGFESPSKAGGLVYVSTFGMPPDQYFVVCESAGGPRSTDAEAHLDLPGLIGCVDRYLLTGLKVSPTEP